MKKYFHTYSDVIFSCDMVERASKNDSMGVMLVRVKPNKEYNAHYALVEANKKSGAIGHNLYFHSQMFTTTKDCDKFCEKIDFTNNEAVAKVFMKYIFTKPGVVLGETARELKRLPLKAFLDNAELIGNIYLEELKERLYSDILAAQRTGSTEYITHLKKTALKLETELPEILDEMKDRAKQNIASDRESAYESAKDAIATVAGLSLKKNK